jgi:hypothetical protein
MSGDYLAAEVRALRMAAADLLAMTTDPSDLLTESVGIKGPIAVAFWLKDRASAIEAEERQSWPYAKDYNPILSALDRCEHGRHAQDGCLSCPDRQSTGNLFLQPGQRIGTTLYGEPITVPADMNNRRNPTKWSEGGAFK